MNFRVLSLDGGGLVSLLPATLIRRIEDARPGFLKRVDLFAGTSAGGIMALILSSAKPVDEKTQACIDLWTKVPVFTSGPVRSAAGLLGQTALFDPKGLTEFLDDWFGDTRLGDLPHRILVPSFKLDGMIDGVRSWRAKVFHNFSFDDEPDVHERAVDVARATSASPITFPIYSGFVDGGLFANDPAMCAITQVIACSEKGKGHDRPLKLSETVLLSMGSGNDGRFVDAPNGDWGWQSWLLGQEPFLLLEAMYDSVGTAVEFQSRRLLGQRYFRLNPSLGQTHNMTGQRNNGITERAKEVAESTDLTRVLDWLDRSGWFEGG